MANIAQRLRQHTNVYAEAARWAIRREVKNGQDLMTFEDGSQLTFELRMVPLPETASGRELLRIAQLEQAGCLNRVQRYGDLSPVERLGLARSGK